MLQNLRFRLTIRIVVSVVDVCYLLKVVSLDIGVGGEGEEVFRLCHQQFSLMHYKFKEDCHAVVDY